MTMPEYNAVQTISLVCNSLRERLDKLNEAGKNGELDKDSFAYGEKTAYVECLEMIQATWEKCVVPDDIEGDYPL